MAWKFAWGNKAKHWWLMSTNFLYSKVCWQHPAMYCLYTFLAHNLNFHWSWRCWDQIQAIFLNLSYSKIIVFILVTGLLLYPDKINRNGDEGSRTFFLNLFIIEIVQIKILETLDEKFQKKWGSWDDALLIYGAPKFTIVYLVKWSVLDLLGYTVYQKRLTFAQIEHTKRLVTLKLIKI